MKHFRFVFSALSNLTTLVLFVLLALVTVITVSSSGPAVNNAVQPSVHQSPVASTAAYSAIRRTSTGDPWFEPDTPVQVYMGSGETGWQTVPYSLVPQGTEYLFEERLYYVDPEGRVAVNRQVTADTVSLAEANRAYQPDNWRWPEPEDLVRYVDEDNHHLRYALADRFKPGDRFWFQGVLYEGQVDLAAPSSFRILNATGYVLGEDGQITQAVGNSPDEMLISQAGLPAGVESQSALPGAGSDVTDIDFTGKRLESFGLLDYGARYYDPVLGRFISPDTIVPDPANPQDLNRYSYVRNNPVNFTDPTGHFTFENNPDDPYDYYYENPIAQYSPGMAAMVRASSPDSLTHWDETQEGDFLLPGKVLLGTALLGASAEIVAADLGTELFYLGTQAFCSDGDCTNEVETITQTGQRTLDFLENDPNRIHHIMDMSRTGHNWDQVIDLTGTELQNYKALQPVFQQVVDQGNRIPLPNPNVSDVWQYTVDVNGVNVLVQVRELSNGTLQMVDAWMP